MSGDLPTDALAIAPDLPRATPVPGEPAPPTDRPPAGDLDKDGVAWDPRYHVSPPRKNIRGRWAGKPGNAGRLRAGKPLCGVAAGAAPVPRIEPTPGASGAEVAAEPVPAEPAAQPSVSRLVWDEPGTDPAAGGMPGLPGEVLRPREAYATTAKGIVRAQFGLATLHIGKAWDAPDKERNEWVEAWQDFLHEYQLPVLGSVLTLVVLLVDSIAKRRNDPDTQRVGATIRDMILGRLRRKVVEVKPEPAQQPITPPPPAPVNPVDGSLQRVTGTVRNPYGTLGK